MPQPPESRRPQRRQFLTGRPGQPVDPGGESGPDPSRPSPEDSSPLFSFSADAMGCQFQVLSPRADQQALIRVMHDGFALIAELESRLSIYRDDSEMSRINRLAATRAVTLADDLFDLLTTAQSLATITGNAFDITASPLSLLWKSRRSSGELPSAAELEPLQQSVGSELMELDPNQRTIRLQHPATRLDLGAIGKGFALDQLASLLQNASVENFVIHGGQSSIVARGQRPRGAGSGQGPWTIGISHPLVPARRLAELAIYDEAMGTSGSGRQAFVHDGKRYGHVIDPRTGWPADHHLSVTIVAPDATRADALATALFVMDDSSIREFAGQHPEYGIVSIKEHPRTPGHLLATVINLDSDRLNWLDEQVDIVNEPT